MAGLTPNLEEWQFIKERGALGRTGAVYCSPDGRFYLRTGELSAIRAEAEFSKMVWRQGLPVPEVTEVGQLADGSGYFVEASAGTENFADKLSRDYAATGRVSDETFGNFSEVVLRFTAAQLQPACRQAGPAQTRAGIELPSVQSENPDIADLLETAVAKAEDRLRGLPLVLTHGDFSPFNILPGGAVDFERRFIAPAGFDAVTAIAFQRLWDHPRPDGAGTMQLWDFDREQIAEFLSEADALFTAQDLPGLSGFFDDFLMLKAIWALCFERPADLSSPQARRWLWRKRVAVYCAECTLAGKPIESEHFRTIGLKETDD